MLSFCKMSNLYQSSQLEVDTKKDTKVSYVIESSQSLKSVEESEPLPKNLHHPRHYKANNIIQDAYKYSNKNIIGMILTNRSSAQLWSHIGSFYIYLHNTFIILQFIIKCGLFLNIIINTYIDIICLTMISFH